MSFIYLSKYNKYYWLTHYNYWITLNSHLSIILPKVVFWSFSQRRTQYTFKNLWTISEFDSKLKFITQSINKWVYYICSIWSSFPLCLCYDLQRLNFSDWWKQIKFHLGVLDLDVTLYAEKLTAITETNSTEERSYYKHCDWFKRLGIIFLRMNIASNIKTTLPKTEKMQKIFWNSWKNTLKLVIGLLLGHLWVLWPPWSLMVHVPWMSMSSKWQM